MTKPIPLPMGPLGEMTHMLVRHHDDCPMISGGDEHPGRGAVCVCDPTIEMLSLDEYMLEVGLVEVH